MTEKLFYNDAYMSEFDARIVEQGEDDKGFYVILDRTAFFPTEAGQSHDNGKISDTDVIDVLISNDIIRHYVKEPIDAIDVRCSINFAERFEKMQCHSAEHIISGIIYKKYGFNNVGFHLGADYVTLDIDAPMTRDMLDEIETYANRAVFDNIKIEIEFPSVNELENMKYRSKIGIMEGIRLVRIGDVDCCACCAPHVRSTGEIGLIKLLDAESHKGGVRVYMQAGYRTLVGYRNLFSSAQGISSLLSIPKSELLPGVKKLKDDYDHLSFDFKQFKLGAARDEANRVVACQGNYVAYFDSFGMDELREFSKYATDKVGGILVSLCGSDGDYKYVISSNTVDLKALTSSINSELNGRGGGRSSMLQGSFSTDLDSIKEYFK